MARTLTLLLAHVVFATKERRPWLDPAVQPALFAYLGGIARESKATALGINGLANPVHLLLVHPPTLALSDLVRLLKANSSLWLHRAHAATHRRFAWQGGFGAFSVSHFTAPGWCWTTSPNRRRGAGARAWTLKES